MLPPRAETGTGVTVDVGVGVSVDHAQKPGPAQPTTDALGVWQMWLFALPLLMTGEEVRDIAWRRSRAVDPAVGEWGQGLGGAGGGDCRPIRRSPAARPPLNDVPTFVLAEKASGGVTGCWCGWCRRARGHADDPDWARPDSSQPPARRRLAGACQRSSRNEWGYVGKRAFDKAFLPHRTLRRLPFAASVGHQGQRWRALLTGPVDRVGIDVESGGAGVVFKTRSDSGSMGLSPMSQGLHSRPGVREGRWCALLEGERRLQWRSGFRSCRPVRVMST